MDQVANLVIDLSLDSQKFKDEVPRIKKMLEDASGKAGISAQRQKNLLEILQKQGRAYVDGSGTVFNATTRQKQALILNSQAYDQVAQRIDITQRNIEALNQKLREEQAQAAAVAQAQDAAAAAFYRQIDSVKQLSGGLQALQRIQAQVRQAKGRGDISQGDYLALVSEAAAKTRELTDAEALATQKKAQFIRRLKEQAAAQNLSRAELLRVKAAELGVSSAADVYIRKLDTATKSTHELGLKSAQARREIGVLIGELARGNFGALRGSGITLANRAGWIEQLMSPKGMMLGGLAGGVTAAVYGLGKAYYEGAKESEEFNKQLILTGSYAGKTAGQLNEMAKSLAGNGVTQHDAAGVLAQVVGSGAFTGQAVAMVSRTAARMQENMGQSVDETIRQFKRLQDDPVNAAKELDRALHFLTATQLEQIRVLGEQGRVADAAKIAMSAYSEEMNKRMGDVHDKLGWIERAWNAVGDAAKWAWDRMLDIGREDTLDEKIATLQEKIARARKTPWTVSSSWTEYDQQQLNELQEQKRQKDLLDAKAQAERTYQETQKRRNEQNAALNRDNETESMRHQREVARISAMQYADAAVRNAALERENERHKKALSQQAKKPKTYHNDEARRLLLQYSQQQAQTEGQ
ncbi:phage tail tape measure protein, partial [Salmonella enterica]|nr:phage tail tape measure protein [Salmonella enterica]